jgi:hypothetical protein
MARPLSFLILVIAVACAALFLLLPMSKMARQAAVDEVTMPYAELAEASSLAATAPLPLSTAPASDIEPDVPGIIAPERVTVTGRVSDNDGGPITGLAIDLHSQDFDGEEIGVKQVLSDRYGNFSLQLVPQRQYRLEIGAVGNHAGYSFDGLTEANAETLQDIVLARVEPVDVDGLIVDTDLAPVGDFELTLRHLTLEIPERVIRSDSSGYFSLRGIPAGAWRIATHQPDYFRIKGLELRPGEYRNLTLMIDRGSYYLSGWVHDRNGLPLEQITVTLKSAFAADEYHSFSYRSSVTDSNGTFEFAQLGGHKMTLGIHAKGFETYIRQHEFDSFSDRLEIELLREESP